MNSMSKITLFSTLLIMLCAFSMSSFAQDKKEEKTDPKIEKQINLLSEDPAFISSMNGIMKIMSGMKKGFQTMPSEQRDEFVKELRTYVKKHENMKDDAGKELLKRLSETSGVSMDDFETVIKSTDGLLDRYPVIGQGPAATAQAMYSSKGIEYNFSDVDPDRECDEACQCIRDCREEARIATNRAGFDAFIDVATNPSVSTFIRWFALGIKIHEIQEAEVECEKLCQDWPPGFDCQSDSECEGDEYCHKPIGNPVNSCWPKKALGDPCSGDRKCLSGCCKYHFMSNPIQMVCRPAGRCN